MRNRIAIALSVLFVFTGAGCSTLKGSKATPVAEKKQAVVKQAASVAPAAAVTLASLGKAPDFSLQDVYLSVYKLSSYENKQPVLLFFWASWCPFCQKELQVLNSRFAALSNSGVELLAINVGEEIEKVQGYIKQNFYPFKVLMDRDTRVTHSYNIMGVPTYILIDTQGNMVFKDNYFPEREYKALLNK